MSNVKDIKAFESAGERFSRRFTQHSIAARRASACHSAKEFLPRADAKVRKTWYTRRDTDGRTVLVQVEEGIEGGLDERFSSTRDSRKRASQGGLRSSIQGACQGAMSRLRLSGRSSSKTKGKEDPFHHVLRRHQFYIHPFSLLMQLWEGLLLLVSTYYIMMPPVRIAFSNIGMHWPQLSADVAGSAVLFVDLFLRFFVAFEDDDAFEAAEKQTVHPR